MPCNDHVQGPESTLPVASTVGRLMKHLRRTVMIARVGYFDNANRFRDGTYSYIQETLAGATGFRGLFHLAGRDVERSLSISLWDNEEDLKAAEADLKARRDQLGVVPSPPTSVETFDVIDYA